MHLYLVYQTLKTISIVASKQNHTYPIGSKYAEFVAQLQTYL